MQPSCVYVYGCGRGCACACACACAWAHCAHMCVCMRACRHTCVCVCWTYRGGVGVVVQDGCTPKPAHALRHAEGRRRTRRSLFRIVHTQADLSRVCRVRMGVQGNVARCFILIHSGGNLERTRRTSSNAFSCHPAGTEPTYRPLPPAIRSDEARRDLPASAWLVFT